MATGGTNRDSFRDDLHDRSDEENDQLEDTSDEENELPESFDHLSITLKYLQKLASKVETKHSTLLQKLGNHLYLLDIEVFYHVTNDTAKENIQRDGRLKAEVSDQPTCRTASAIDKMEIGGVHFRLNLDKNTGNLPTTSPFGNKRICIPISYFSGYELFFNHYNRQWNTGGHEIYFVSLVLVKPSHDDYDDIKKVLKKLDPEDNAFVDFDHENETYRYYNYYKLNELQPGKKRRTCFNVHYEIVVLGDILLPVWDDVTKRK